MKFGTEIMAGLFTTQAVLFFFFGRGDFSEHSIQKPENHPKERKHSQHGECLKTRLQASVCVKNIIRTFFLHFGLFLKSKSRYCCECTLYFVLQGHCPSLQADR